MFRLLLFPLYSGPMGIFSPLSDVRTLKHESSRRCIDSQVFQKVCVCHEVSPIAAGAIAVNINYRYNVARSITSYTSVIK